MTKVKLTVGIVGGASDTAEFQSIAAAVFTACSIVKAVSMDFYHPQGIPESWWIGSRKSGRRTSLETWESPQGVYVTIERKEPKQ